MRKRLILAVTLFLVLVWVVAGPLTGAPAQEEEQLPPTRLNQKTADLIRARDWIAARDALLEMQRAPNADPNIKYYLAMCYSRMGQAALDVNKFDDAVSHFDTGLSYTREYPSIFLGLGVAYFKLSDYSRAEDAFNMVLELKPDHYLALRLLGEINYLTDEPEDAVDNWEQALTINGADQTLKDRLTKLKKQLALSRDLDMEMDNVFTVTFDGRKDPRLRDSVMNSLSEIYDHVGDQLNLYPNRRITVVLLTQEAFSDITGSPEWSSGAYEGQIKLPVENYHPKRLKIILCHEYIHAVIHDALPNRCPWWLNEGLAQYFSGDTRGNKTKLKLAARVLKKEGARSVKALPGDIRGDTKAAEKAYALALAAVDYLIREFGVYQLQSILEHMAKGRSFDVAIQRITGYSFNEFETNWLETTQ